MSKKTDSKEFLWQPKYWGSWLGVFILWVSAKLPYRWQLQLGKGLGVLAYKIMKSRRRIAAINVSKCFPEYSTEKVDAMVRENFIAFGQGILSSAVAWWASDKRLKKLLHKVNGLEHLEAAFAKGKGVIILTAHFLFDEMGAHLTKLACQQTFSVMHRRQSDKVFEKTLQKGRTRYFNKVIIRDNVRGMIRALKQNHAVVYLPDQNFEREHSIFVPFMGVNTLTLTATARFAKINNCVVVPEFCYQSADGKGYELDIWPALENYPTGDDHEDAIRINQILEKAIRKHPTQYMWIHRRFKIRPDGEADFYQ